MAAWCSVSTARAARQVAGRRPLVDVGQRAVPQLVDLTDDCVQPTSQPWATISPATDRILGRRAGLDLTLQRLHVEREETQRNAQCPPTELGIP